VRHSPLSARLRDAATLPARPGPARVSPAETVAAETVAPPLVAVAHGSRDPRAAASVGALLDLVRRRAAGAGYPGLGVRAAYLGHAAPTLGQALGALEGEAVVLPLLLTAAYHSKSDIPKALHEARTAQPRLGIAYGRPLGPHPLLLRALDRRLAEALGAQCDGAQCDGPQCGGDGSDRSAVPPEDTAVVLAAAGSSDPAANAVIADLAARWQSARGWRAVLPAYASAASPAPPDAVAAARRAGARQVLVASYLLSPGIFADQIRRYCLAAGATAVSGVLGPAPEVADVLLGRYAESLADGAAAAV
jgi:sirohydrochlorin ferrochelatase